MARIARPRPPSKRFWELYRDGVTQSLLETLICPQKAHLAYERGYTVTRYKGALAFGNLFHETMDCVYSCGVSNLQALQLAARAFLEASEYERRQLLQEEPDADAEAALDELYGMVGILADAYLERWHAEDFQGGRNWISTEQRFSVPFCNVNVHGKIDGMYRAKNRRVWVKETKTKGQIQEATLADRLNYDLQSMIYLLGAQELTGEEPAGTLYDVARRPQLRHGAKESLADFLERVESDIADRPDFYFVRFEVAYSPQEISVWREEFAAMIEYAKFWADGRFRFRRSGACESKYGACEFLAFCARGDMTGLHVREVPFPELVQLEG